MFDKYQPMELPTKQNPESQKTRLPSDERLAAEKEILGVFDQGNSRAYPLDALAQAGLIQESVDGQPRVVFWHEPTHTAVAYRSVAMPADENETDKARTVMLQRLDNSSAGTFFDKETGSQWDLTGRATDGALKGWTLQWLDGTQVKWFAWAAEHPETSIYNAKVVSQ
jgi:hypothetical protein